MSTAKIDKYIAGRAEWAHPLLTRIRSAIIEANSKIIEDWKWGGPAFTHHGIVCMLWGFKAHVSITFYHGALLVDKTDKFDPTDDENRHNRAMRFEAGDKIPTAEITKLIKLACKNNEQGVAPPKKKAVRKEASISADIVKELKKNKQAGKFFDSLAPSYQRLHTEWIDSARREETKRNRIDRALKRLAGGHKQPYC
ncbi:MAG: YdeI/OmpD-associated family protein [Limisphaerales bacterium]